jgi:hypothetical protein
MHAVEPCMRYHQTWSLLAAWLDNDFLCAAVLDSKIWLLKSFDKLFAVAPIAGFASSIAMICCLSLATTLILAIRSTEL